MSLLSEDRNRIVDTGGQDVHVDRRAPKRLFWAGGIGVLGLAALSVWAIPFVGRYLSSDAFFDRDRARLAVVRRGDFERSIAVEGKVVSAFSPKLFAAQDGNVFLQVDEGERVSEGQLVARIDNPELESRLHQDEAALMLLEVELGTHRNQIKREELEGVQNLELLQINLGAERRELDRMAKIVATGGVSNNDYDRSRDKVQALEVQVRNTRDQNALILENHRYELQTKALGIDQKRLAVTELQRQFDELNVTSPVNGVVGNIEVNERDLVTRNQAIMTVVDLSAYEIDVLVPETYAQNLAIGLSVEVTYRDQSYDAVLDAVSPEVTDGSVAARVAFRGELPRGLRQNLRVNNKIIIEHKPDSLLVKRGPFVESHGGRGVYVVDGDVARYRGIEVGSLGVSDVEIIGGLEVGERVIISDTSELFGAKQVLLTN